MLSQILINQHHKITLRILSSHPILTGTKCIFYFEKIALDTMARMFQYKVLHNTLYVNNIFSKFGKVVSPRCSFCKTHEETIMHLFYDYLIAKALWNQLKSILSNNINFPVSTLQIAIFRFWDLDTNEHLILNHLLLIFKMYIYNARTTSYLNISHLLVYIKDKEDIEKKLCEKDVKRRKKFNKKWKKCFNKLTELN